VGVIEHILHAVATDLGHDVELPVLSGTSVGAINVCVLAALADQPRGRASQLCDTWTSLDIEQILRPDGCRLLALLAGLGGVRGRPSLRAPRLGGILDFSGIEHLLSGIPFARIEANLRDGRLRAVTMATTEVETGRTVVFVATTGRLARWRGDPTVTVKADSLGLSHALASAAVPPLFPAVRIGDGYYCDGGLRQNVPLAPALHMGADALLVITPHHVPTATPTAAVAKDRERSFTEPLFLLGKTLSALLLDRVDGDLERTQQINAILSAAMRRCGPGIVDEIGHRLQATGLRPLRPVDTLLVRASRSIGRLAADYVRTAAFRRRARGLVGRVLQRLAEGEAESEADLLSYLLFDGEFARELIELGQQDARARHEELCRFFSSSHGAAAARPPRRRSHG
jgi:NTE family protein